MYTPVFTNDYHYVTLYYLICYLGVRREVQRGDSSCLDERFERCSRGLILNLGRSPLFFVFSSSPLFTLSPPAKEDAITGLFREEDRDDRSLALSKKLLKGVLLLRGLERGASEQGSFFLSLGSLVAGMLSTRGKEKTLSSFIKFFEGLLDRAIPS